MAVEICLLVDLGMIGCRFELISHKKSIHYNASTFEELAEETFLSFLYRLCSFVNRSIVHVGLRHQPSFPLRHSAPSLIRQPICGRRRTMKYAILTRNALKRSSITSYSYGQTACYSNNRLYHGSPCRPRPSLEPRLEDHGKVIVDEYSIIRDKYGLFL